MICTKIIALLSGQWQHTQKIKILRSVKVLTISLIGTWGISGILLIATRGAASSPKTVEPNATSSPSSNPVTWTTDKPLHEVLPDHDLVTITLKTAATPGPDPQNSKKGTLNQPSPTDGNRPTLSPDLSPFYRVQLIAPRTHPLFTTDFPHVEGSTLVDVVLPFDEGTSSFNQVFPIRGTYTLRVTPVLNSPTGPGSRNDLASGLREVDFKLPVAENPDKIKTLGLFSLGLFVLSLVSGYILARGHYSRMALSTAGMTSLLAALAGQGSGIFLPVLSTPSWTVPIVAAPWSTGALAHGGGHQKKSPHSDKITAPGDTKPSLSHGHESPGTAEVPSRWRLHLDNKALNSRVGEPSRISGELQSPSGQKVPAVFHLQLVQLEHGIEVFSTKIVSSDGSFDWQGSFFDGSPHEVRLTAIPIGDQSPSPQDSPASATWTVEVEGVEPPLSATIKSLAFFLLVSTLGLAVGILAAFVTRRPEALNPALAP